VDRIGVGFFALTVYALAYPDSNGYSAGLTYPASYAIQEGGTVSFTYSEEPPYKNPEVVYVLSKTVTDASGTSVTSAIPDPSPVKDWSIQKGTLTIDAESSFSSGLNVDDLVARLGTPISDKTAAYDVAPIGKYRARTIAYDGLTLVFFKNQDTKTPALWEMRDCAVAESGWSTPRGLAIGESDLDVMRSFGTGDFLLDADLSNGALQDLKVYDRRTVFEGTGVPAIIEISFQDGKVSAFEFRPPPGDV